MKLDRNLNGDGRGKYGIVRTRKLVGLDPSRSPGEAAVASAVRVLEEAGILDWGTTPETEFFVLLLKDRFSRPALESYAGAAFSFPGPDRAGLTEYASDVYELAARAGKHHPACKTPD